MFDFRGVIGHYSPMDPMMIETLNPRAEEGLIEKSR